MIIDQNNVLYNSLDTLISDAGTGSEEYYNLPEVIQQLECYYNGFQVSAMNDDQSIFLQGQKNMLKKIIYYLKKITGIID